MQGNLMITGTGPMYDYSWESYTKTCTSWWGNSPSTKNVKYSKSTAPWFENLAPGDSYNAYTYGFNDLMAYNKTPIENVVIGEGVTTVGDHAFHDSCHGSWEMNENYYVSTIGSISLPDTIVSIGDWAFNGCNLQSINIPGSVEAIGDEAFNFSLSFYDEDGNRLSKDAESLAGYSYVGNNERLYRTSSRAE
jgi:hypothetical protein